HQVAFCFSRITTQLPMSTITFYQSTLAHCNEQTQRLRKQMNGVALLRLALFAGLIGSVYSLFRGYTPLLLLLTIGLLAVFIISVNIYFRLKDQRALWERLAWINTNELTALSGGGNGFPEGGSFLDSDNYLDDLDIFGRQSIFHALNRTTTSHGTDVLADLLRNSLLSVESIATQQEAVRALAGASSQRQLLTAKGLLAGEKEGNLDNIAAWLDTPPLLYPRKVLRIFLNILAAYNLAAAYYYLASNNYTFLLLGAAAAWSLTGFYAKYISRQHLLIARKQAILDQYAGILSVFHTVEPGNSVLLQGLKNRTGKAHKAIRQLSRLSSFFDQRMNMLVNLFFNTFFCYDLRCLIALERWKVAHKDVFPGWIEAVGQVECLNSLATFAFNNPDYTYPQATAGGGLFIEATRLAHPLIPAAQRVANDFAIGRSERLILVTGSNMSGKTTFLRTLGVGLLMAQCGLPVCAASFSFTPLYLLTSLRISDSLQEHTSYFMAELKKLRNIVHRLQTGLPALVLIDEILRGTNSEDKTHGSELFIRKLLQYHCLSLFATHDLSLGQLEQELPDAIRNYCFESVIEDGELHFNYQLQRGIARNRNASFLMKKMEII
ncbi:MAG TPA: hypothetical protein VI233_03480, partial [Puia sp.]